MGIDLWNFRFLLEARRRAPDLGALLQIGRQDLNIPVDVYPIANALLHEHGIDRDYGDITGGNRYADQGMLQALGASSVASADASAYEGADLVHDFNDPIPSSHHLTWDTIFDGGSLEHIFNVPMALANEMNLLRVGGRLLTSVPSNNWLGHSFYQFSPELPFRVFTEINGFKLHAVYLTEFGSSDRLYEVEDLSRRAGGEIGTTHTNTSLLFIAEKIAHVQPFRRWPQQGDYRSAWEEFQDDDADRRATGMILPSLLDATPSTPGLFSGLKALIGAR